MLKNKTNKETFIQDTLSLPKWVILKELYLALLIWPILPFLFINPITKFLNVIDNIFEIFSPIIEFLWRIFILFYVCGGIYAVFFFKCRIKKITKSNRKIENNKKLFFIWPTIPFVCLFISFLLSFFIKSKFLLSIELISTYLILFSWIPLLILFGHFKNYKTYIKVLVWILFILLIPYSFLYWSDQIKSGMDFSPIIWSLIGLICSIFYLKVLLNKSILLSMIFIILLSFYSFIGYTVHCRLTCFFEHGKYVYECLYTDYCHYVCKK